MTCCAIKHYFFMYSATQLNYVHKAATASFKVLSIAIHLAYYLTKLYKSCIKAKC